ncbi:hypothetical protein [Kineosporia sp. NBRC 101731]|uniref:hypothetical protein n=1 Tax=Kineosporia sp. NBRC 101731 TaxID=3032199 RepID=UPI0024A3877C|nr:hypothetical protein [Kineosporia sp. NBRC 101731]GLY28076.1 hypothetical protein Kisp02_14410 [Kineosporia sp. NBRC 101731]
MTGLGIDLRDTAGSAVTLELRIFRASVECWVGDNCYAVFDREALRHWLARPGTVLSYEGISWARAGQGVVAITVDGVVPRWPLADHVLDGLRSRI